MKSGIHPDYHMITVEMTDGTKFQSARPGARKATRSTSTSTRRSIRRGPAEIKLLDSGGQVARFNKRFGGLTLGKK